MPLDKMKVAEAQAALALGLLVDPSTVPDVNRAILLLDEAREGYPGLQRAIDMLFNKPVPRITEAIIAIRTHLPPPASITGVDAAMQRLQAAFKQIEALNMPMVMWRQMIDSGPTDRVKAMAARRLQMALAQQQQNADALKRSAADVSGCLSVVYMEHQESDRESSLSGSSRSQS